jgi:hypothetical protein
LGRHLGHLRGFLEASGGIWKASGGTLEAPKRPPGIPNTSTEHTPPEPLQQKLIGGHKYKYKLKYAGESDCTRPPTKTSNCKCACANLVQPCAPNALCTCTPKLLSTGAPLCCHGTCGAPMLSPMDLERTLWCICKISFNPRSLFRSCTPRDRS